MFEDDLTAQMTRHCLVREELFSMNQLLNVVFVSSNELDESLLNFCNEAIVDFMTDGN